MTEYINREDLITACKNTHYTVSANEHPYDVAARVGKYFRRCVDEAPAVFFDNDRQKLIDLLIAREEIKDANAYDRAECLADYLLENGYGYRKQTEGKVDK